MILSLVYDCILPDLRDFFITSWNKVFAENPWLDSKDNRKALMGKIKNSRRDALIKDRILKGGIDTWDATCVFKALLVFEPKSDESVTLDESVTFDESVTKNINKLKDVRDTVSHPSALKCSDGKKDDIFKRVNEVYDELEWPKGHLKEAEQNVPSPEHAKKLKKAGNPLG